MSATRARQPHIGALIILLLSGLEPVFGAEKKISVALPDSLPPYSFLDSRGEPSGYLVDLWKLFGERAGFVPIFMPMPDSQALEAVLEGRADAHAGVYSSTERIKLFSFSEPIIPVDLALFVAVGSKAEGPEDIDPSRLGVLEGSYEEALLLSYYPDRSPVKYSKMDLLVEAGLRGELDAFVTDLPTGRYLLESRRGPEKFRPARIIVSRNYHAAAAKGNREAISLINRALERVDKEERLRLLGKWLTVQRVETAPAWLLTALGIALAAIVAVMLSVSILILRREVARRTAEIAEDRERIRTLLEEKTGLLDEKELLLKEIHHRVKNNLAVAASLLSLQAGFTESPEARAAMEDARERIQTMALLYDRLYKSSDFRRIELRAYLSEVLDELAASLVGMRPIRVERELAEVSMDPKRAVLIGIILSELVTNSCKYAFPEGRPGRLLVVSRVEGERLRFFVADDGVGMRSKARALVDDPSSASEPHDDGDGFGLTVVRGLATQLGDEPRFGPGLAPGPGLRVELCFPVAGKSENR